MAKKKGRQAEKEAPKPAPESEPEPAPKPEPEKPKAKAESKGASAEEEKAALKKTIEEAQERLEKLEHPFQEFPKMVHGLVVENAEQEAAVKAGTAKLETVKSAQGDIVEVK